MTVAQLEASRSLLTEPDAEKAVLGSILEVGDRALLRIPNAREELFANTQNRVVWRAIALLSEEREPIDLLTVKASLRNRGQAKAAGGEAYLSSLLDVVPDVANLEKYVQLLEEAAKRRAIVAACREAERSAVSGDLASETMAKLFSSIGDQATPQKMQARPICEVAAETASKMRDLGEKNISLSLCTSWIHMDQLKVFVPTFSVMGGHSKMGKSAAMIALADDLARNGSPTAIFSLESRKHEIALRHMSMTTRINHSRMRDWRTFGESDHQRMREYSSEIASRKLYIEDRLNTAEDIVMELRRLKSVHGIKAAFVDYIQNVELRRRVDNREERLHEISRMFLDTANDMEIHIMAMSQLRDDAAKDGKRYSIGDLAYAKSIAKSARIVMFLSRPFKLNPIINSGGESHVDYRDPRHMDIQVEANNEGPTGDFVAQFDEIRQRVWEGKCEKPCGHPDCSREQAEVARQERLY